METATRLAERQPVAVSVMPTPGPEVARTLSVTATYLLSEDGRKASLLAGGDGHAVQQIPLEVPANRLHLVSVDKQGVARLKLRPRFERQEDTGIVRIDAAPMYDAPPSIDDLYRVAAKNHELETAYDAARSAQRSQRHDAARELRERIAEGFLADKVQRAIAHPPPSPKRCYVVTDTGRLLFDVSVDIGVAKDVPPEAHRRFRADLRAKDERNRQDRATQLALHEEKKRFVAEWIAANGSEEQKGRQAAGVLPMDEAVDAITDHVFSCIGDRTLYTRDGAEQIQARIRRLPQHADVTITTDALAISSANAVKATQAQWALVQEVQALKPDAAVTLRIHKVAWKEHQEAATVVVMSILVTSKHGPFTLRREYAAPSE
jgi:hypothetical protein